MLDFGGQVAEEARQSGRFHAVRAAMLEAAQPDIPIVLAPALGRTSPIVKIRVLPADGRRYNAATGSVRVPSEKMFADWQASPASVATLQWP